MIVVGEVWKANFFGLSNVSPSFEFSHSALAKINTMAFNLGYRRYFFEDVSKRCIEQRKNFAHIGFLGSLNRNVAKCNASVSLYQEFFKK